MKRNETDFYVPVILPNLPSEKYGYGCLECICIQRPASALRIHKPILRRWFSQQKNKEIKKRSIQITNFPSITLEVHDKASFNSSHFKGKNVIKDDLDPKSAFPLVKEGTNVYISTKR